MNFNHHAGHHLATDLQLPVIDDAQQVVVSKLSLCLGNGRGGGAGGRDAKHAAPPCQGDHEVGVVAPPPWPHHHQTEGVHPDRSQNILYLNTNTFSKSLHLSFPTALLGHPSGVGNPSSSEALHDPALRGGGYIYTCIYLAMPPPRPQA